MSYYRIRGPTDFDSYAENNSGPRLNLERERRGAGYPVNSPKTDQKQVVTSSGLVRMLTGSKQILTFKDFSDLREHVVKFTACHYIGPNSYECQSIWASGGKAPYQKPVTEQHTEDSLAHKMNDQWVVNPLIIIEGASPIRCLKRHDQFICKSIG